MTLLPNYSDTLAPTHGLEPFLQDGQANMPTLNALDEQLLAKLRVKNRESEGFFSAETGLQFANDELARLARGTYSALDLTELETLLNQKGTLAIPVANGYTVPVDTIERSVAIVAATEVSADSPNHGDMSSMLYLRDHVQAASALMELNLQDPERYSQEGETSQTLLLSALHLMSTPSQLARFEDVIRRGSEAGQADWPHISLRFDDLEGTKPNGWRNKQDTFQMLAYLTLDAVERDFLSIDELADGHKQFLGSVVPFLASVGFPKYENSGSWEEVAANRTSVMAIETALLHKIKTLAEKGDAFSFLQDGYDQAQVAPGSSFTETLDTILHDGLHEIGRRLPYESPDYDQNSVKFREADAALAYVLMYDLPRLLADGKVPIGTTDPTVMTPQAIENMIIEQLSTLIDPVTNGIARYEEDSYQRVNFHTNEVQWIINTIKRKVQKDAEQAGGEINLDEKQALRGELTPQGKTAAWTHPLGQMAAWAAGRSLQAVQENDPDSAKEYRELSTRFLNQVLSTVTGENQWHAALDEDGRYYVRQVPAYKLPECLVTYEPHVGASFATPSPHTPLNWSSATVKQAVGLLRVSTSN